MRHHSTLRPARRDSRRWRRCLALAGVLVAAGVAAAVEPAADPLRQGFLAPPDSAKPRVWWHWMGGDVNPAAIALDLQWMKRVGIGGFQHFDIAASSAPRPGEKRLPYMSPGWQEAFRSAIDLGDSLGLEMGIASSPGWSETGGPWVTPQQAMKKLVWSMTEVTGGKAEEWTLAPPPTAPGPFQDSRDEACTDKFYADCAVVAFRSLPADPRPERLLTNAGPLDFALLTDGRLARGIALPSDSAGKAWLAYWYAEPQTLRTLTIALPVTGWGVKAVMGRLEASADGNDFQLVAEFTASSFAQRSVSFAPVTAKVFRLTLSPAADDRPLDDMARGAAPGVEMLEGMRANAQALATRYPLHEFALHSAARIHQFEAKAGFAVESDYYALDGPPSAPGAAIPRGQVIDLTAKMDAQGVLHWTPPPGNWTVLRLGYSLTGRKNGPAGPEATGLEVDKLNPGHVQAYWDKYLETYATAVGPGRIGARGIRTLVLDSIEAGAQNWTEDLPAVFRSRRGYELTPWLPALTGVVVESTEASDKFLWDFRRTIAEMLATNHYELIARRAHERGLTVYGEALEENRPALGDDMEMRRHADVPMAAMWAFHPENGPKLSYLVDTRGAASVAHVYGQNLAAAESMTSLFAPWAYSPRDLRPIVDLEFALGINRPVIHSVVHQSAPDRKPGNSLFIFGQYFNRNETWAEESAAWLTYLARSSWLLEQGRFHADVAYFYGEEAPLTGLYGKRPVADAPDGYAYDFVNADVLLNLFQVDRGMLTTPSGMRYRVLYLGGSSARMTLPVLRKLRDLVAAGAVVVGNRPVASPSLADAPAEFARLAGQLWPAGETESRIGPGRVYAGMRSEEVLAALGLAPDFAYTKPHSDTTLLFVHRQLPDGELYYVSNRRQRREQVEATFRVTGKIPELWHADSGRTELVSYRSANGLTKIPLTLQPDESVFVVFRPTTTATGFAAAECTDEVMATIAGSWDVTFDEKRGGPASITMDALASWSTSDQEGIKYYSGSAVYIRSIEAPAQWFGPGRRLLLDLGEVRDLATVKVNGEELGILWHEPWQVDVTDLLRPGANRLEIKVTNLWVNRLIGDRQPGGKKYTVTTRPTYTAAAPLRPSGLLGPVRILSRSPPKSPAPGPRAD